MTTKATEIAPVNGVPTSEYENSKRALLGAKNIGEHCVRIAVYYCYKCQTLLVKAKDRPVKWEELGKVCEVIFDTEFAYYQRSEVAKLCRRWGLLVDATTPIELPLPNDIVDRDAILQKIKTFQSNFAKGLIQSSIKAKEPTKKEGVIIRKRLTPRERIIDTVSRLEKQVRNCDIATQEDILLVFRLKELVCENVKVK